MWQKTKKSLRRVFEFEDFKSSMDFVRKVAALAEKHNHHPDILIEYDKVTLTLTTHHAGSIVTDLDEKMASEIDGLLA
ncbi:MAG: 4a-hydroxytetrahydrobiopterin dehydratase [Patescibacteria group bacterium]|nr:4a-hydroxytetrahydrobiopterin dehydratase [Patescibacteria group bacterium]